MNNHSIQTKKLNFWTKLAYGAGDLGTAMCVNIQVFFLLFFFTNVAGLPAGIAGSILMIGKISDAINDPIIGVMSDRTVHPWGRRYPWMVFGAIPLGILFFLLWIIPSTNQSFLFWYYVVIAVLFSIAYTVVNLPYAALTPELTQDYNERTSLNSFRFAFSIGGSIFSLVIAQLIFSIFKDNPTQQYLVLGIVCGTIAILPIYWCFFGTRKRTLSNNTKQEENNNTNLPIVEQIRIAFSNRPFLFVIGIYLCSWLAVQLTASVLPYFVVNWMQLRQATFPQVAMAVQGTSLSMLFVWSFVSKKVGKKAVYFMGVCLWIIAQGGLFFIQPGQIGLMYFLAVMAGFGISTAYLVPWSLIPDVIDLDELNTGQRREGIFYSFMVFLQKIGLAIGLFLVGKALDIAGFIETASGETPPIQPDSALLAIRVAIGPLPTIFLIIGLLLAYLYPITREVHNEILLKLRERK
ncbi:MAG: MFS transporter [Okeania sp. SIO3I5]|uniref:MFS transporter n=1 Tax=Okeania sp. SIO3I5 TaxID=2607805 RepID=UPI0013B6C625|nr:MFS transporter [Okeania sp. SIO3I5]NEQ35417.1 MFS transporter [Okeania sp. SIO3I5]